MRATLQALGLTAAFAIGLGVVGPALDGATYSSYGYTPQLAGEVSRLEADARQRCDAKAGQNSGWIQLADGQIACADKHGRRARRSVATATTGSEP